MKSKPTTSHDKLYRDDPAFALEVINGILENVDQAELVIALRQMAHVT